MTEEEEKIWWFKMVGEIRKVLTIEAFAESVGVTERTICNWQNGERPMGLKAIRVYLLHVKLCSGLQGSAVHSHEIEKA